MDIRDHFNPSFYRVMDFIEFCVAILTGIASVFAIVMFFRDQSNILFAAVGGAFAFIMVIFGLKIVKDYRIHHRRFEVVTMLCHEFSHRIRDNYFFLHKCHSKGELSAEVLRNMLQSIGILAANCVARILCESTGQKVSAHIECFYGHDGTFIRLLSTDKEKIENCLVKTLCRSDNSDKERGSEDRHLVGQSTELMHIMADSHPHFYAQDLRTLDRILQKTGQCYLNPRQSLWIKYYRSRAVVPIRMEDSYISESGIEGKGFVMLGFLFADSLSTSAFRISDSEINLNLMKAFADQIFHIFERIAGYLVEIESGKRF